MELHQLRALVATVERGSILEASRVLGLSAATLRARLDALEVEIGTALLVRTHRGVEVTERGAAFLVGAQELIQSADALVVSAMREDDDFIGVLCVMGPGSSLPPMMSVVVASELRRRHPELKLCFRSSENPRRDAGPDVDMILYFGEMADEGPYRTFSIARFPVLLLASTDYLAARGRPVCVEDLAQHDLLSWESPPGDGIQWPLLSGGTFEVDPCIVSTDVLRLRAFVAAGLGIGLLPDSPLARGTIPGEDLEVVLPELVGREGVLRVMIRETAAGSARTRAVKRLLREVAEGLFGVISSDWLATRSD